MADQNSQELTRYAAPDWRRDVWEMGIVRRRAPLFSLPVLLSIVVSTSVHAAVLAWALGFGDHEVITEQARFTVEIVPPRPTPPPPGPQPTPELAPEPTPKSTPEPTPEPTPSFVLPSEQLELEVARQPQPAPEPPPPIPPVKFDTPRHKPAPPTEEVARVPPPKAAPPVQKRPTSTPPIASPPQPAPAQPIARLPEPQAPDSSATYHDAELGNKPPAYPQQARTEGHEGRVTVAVTVATSGLPRLVWIAESSGVDLLDRAAIQAVRKWRFLPARQGGQTVESNVTVPITFRLRN